MPKLHELVKKGIRIFLQRLRTQGGWTTLLWVYGRGLPAITGVPLLKFSQVTPNLYVGPQYRQNGKKVLLREGINAVVNMRIEKDDAQFDLALPNYLHLPTIDDDAPSVEQLNLGVSFIRKIIRNGGKVYIHCGAGVGRAPSMAAAYLIAEGYTMDEALQKIRRVRPFIAITPPQYQQLIRYETLMGSKTEASHSA